MLSGSIEDRREIIRTKLEAMAEQSATERITALREIATSVLSFSPVNDASIAIESPVLPESGTVIGKLENTFGPDFTAIHFDLPQDSKTARSTPRVTNPQVQAANEVVQRYAGEEQNPLLIFTLPDDSGIQFVTGNLSLGNRNRLDDVQRLSLYWRSLNRTAVDCLDRIGMEIAGDQVPERAFRTALSIQPVTNEFFKDYKAAYDRTVASLTGTLEKEAAEQFTQTLFNRLLFIHFISKKGWVTWNGNPDYLNALLRDYQNEPGQTNFHSDRLSVIFHEGMNTPENQRDPVTESIIGIVPFLNGGLFDRNELDQMKIQVDDDIISGIIGTGGLFSQYNFTVTEATPLDTEVAVDPEMLGKLFEETVNERHHHGAYYTPRPVVAFMCREALKGFINGRDIAGLDDDMTADLVDGRNPDATSQQQALEVANAVKDVKVVDPACGSGAFLLGMQQEILTLNETLFRATNTSESLYKQKLDIITNNIFGADKDGTAVSTAMLRLWLSLAVDYEGEGVPDPLPNLDMKVIIGDSLAGPNPQLLDFTLANISRSELRKRIAEYTTAQGSRKTDLKKAIQKTKQRLRDEMGDAAPAGVVEWRIEFADVMLNGGFDTVITNPPYGITVRDTRSTLIGHSDSYTNFMALAGDLAPKGTMAYITPTSWETGERFEKFRKYLFSRMAVRSVVNLPYDVFDTPYVDTAILTGVFGQTQSNEFRLATLDKRAELDLTQMNIYTRAVNWDSVSRDVHLRVPLLDWAANLFGRISANAVPLGQITSSKRGIEAYQFNIKETPEQGDSPFFNGQVRRYRVEPSTTSSFVAIREKDGPFHTGPRILTRRIVTRSNRLSSALTEDDFVVKKDIYSTRPISQDRQELSCLLGILNSNLISFLYLSRSAAAVKDDFRQVTLAGLRELPIIFPPSSGMYELEELVSNRQIGNGEVHSLERRIDDIVYETYGVSKEEQEAISEWLSRSG